MVTLPPVLRFLYFNDAMARAFAQAAGRACVKGDWFEDSL
jgi:hypothetical protein